MFSSSGKFGDAPTRKALKGGFGDGSENPATLARVKRERQVREHNYFYYHFVFWICLISYIWNNIKYISCSLSLSFALSLSLSHIYLVLSLSHVYHTSLSNTIYDIYTSHPFPLSLSPYIHHYLYTCICFFYVNIHVQGSTSWGASTWDLKRKKTESRWRVSIFDFFCHFTVFQV